MKALCDSAKALKYAGMDERQIANITGLPIGIISQL